MNVHSRQIARLETYIVKYSFVDIVIIGTHYVGFQQRHRRPYLHDDFLSLLFRRSHHRFGMSIMEKASEADRD